MYNRWLLPFSGYVCVCSFKIWIDQLAYVAFQVSLGDYLWLEIFSRFIYFLLDIVSLGLRLFRLK